MRSFLRATAVHSANYNGEEYPWQPSRQTVALFAQNILLYVDNVDDKAVLEDYFNQNGSKSTALELQSASGRVALELLTKSEAVEIDDALTQIPAGIEEKMAAISPSNGLDDFQAQLFIMHGVSDPYVPVVESYRLADAIDDPT